MWYHLIWYNDNNDLDVVWFDLILCDMILNDVIWYDIMSYDMIGYDIKWCDIILYEMRWCLKILNDMILHDMMLHDVICYDRSYDSCHIQIMNLPLWISEVLSSKPFFDKKFSKESNTENRNDGY